MKVEKDWKGKSGIYKISLGLRCYVGSSKELYDRLSVHISQLRGNYHHSRYMQRVFNKYGENQFNIEILEYLEYDEQILREKELYYINLLNPVFNSTTPLEYHHSNDMKNRISTTLKYKYNNGEIIHHNLGKGKKVNIYNKMGDILYNNKTIQEAVTILNISNKSVLNNQLRNNNGIYISKNGEYFILNVDKDINNLFSFIKNNIDLRNIPLFKINNDNTIHKCSISSRFRVLEKVLNSNNLVYYSKKSNSYYTFIGLIKNAVLNRNI